jgi:hypothetical protein
VDAEALGEVDADTDSDADTDTEAEAEAEADEDGDNVCVAVADGENVGKLEGESETINTSDVVGENDIDKEVKVTEVAVIVRDGPRVSNETDGEQLNELEIWIIGDTVGDWETLIIASPDCEGEGVVENESDGEEVMVSTKGDDVVEIEAINEIIGVGCTDALNAMEISGEVDVCVLVHKQIGHGLRDGVGEIEVEVDGVALVDTEVVTDAEQKSDEHKLMEEDDEALIEAVADGDELVDEDGDAVIDGDAETDSEQFGGSQVLTEGD